MTKWSEISSLLPGRLGKQCRDRWYNQLDPTLNREPWTEEEDNILLKLHEKLGNRWIEISRQLPGNAWYAKQ